MRYTAPFAVAVLVLAASPAPADDFKEAILRSKHNFAAGSPSEMRSVSEKRVCIFCHTPHAAKAATPLWNHKDSTVAEYGVYSSSTLQSQLGQPAPTDSSKLCLSCHDGTVALGDVAGGAPIPFLQGSQYRIPASSPSNIHKGTGLVANHPFAFKPANTAETLKPPVKDAVHLDPGGRLQCTTCHDPHNEYIDPTVGKF